MSLQIEQFREFASAVVRQLPDIDPKDAQLLIDEQHRLRAALKNAFQAPNVLESRVVVDPAMPMSVLVENVDDFIGNLDSWEDQCKIPEARSVVEFRWVRFGHEQTAADARELLGKMGLRPATFFETLTFFSVHKHLRRDWTYGREEYKGGLDFKQLLPLVIFCSESYLAVVSDAAGAEMHSGDVDDIFWADTNYPAVVL